MARRATTLKMDALETGIPDGFDNTYHTFATAPDNTSCQICQLKQRWEDPKAGKWRGKSRYKKKRDGGGKQKI